MEERMSEFACLASRSIHFDALVSLDMLKVADLLSFGLSRPSRMRGPRALLGGSLVLTSEGPLTTHVMRDWDAPA